MSILKIFDPNFWVKIHRNEHGIQEICQNRSNYHTFREFSIVTAVFYGNSIVLWF